MSGLADLLASQAPARLDWTLAPGDTGVLELEIRDTRGRLIPLDTVTSARARVARVAGYVQYVDLTVGVNPATSGTGVGLMTVTAEPSQASLLPASGEWSLVLYGATWTKTVVAGTFRAAEPQEPATCGQVVDCGCG